MTRRDAVGLVGRIAATAAGQVFLSSWLAAAHEGASSAPPAPDRWKNYVPKFFSPEQYNAIDQFTAILLPTDETPGAREANIAPFIDFLLSQAGEYAPEMQTQWRHAVDWLMQNEFLHKTEPDQIAFMTDASQTRHPAFPQFQLMKDLSVFAFYTSRAGLIDNLEYKGLAYLTEFPGCTHSEHHTV